MTHETNPHKHDVIDPIWLDTNMQNSFEQALQSKLGNSGVKISERIFSLDRNQATAVAGIMRGIITDKERPPITDTGVLSINPEDPEAPATLVFPAETANRNAIEQGTHQLIEATNQQLEVLGSSLRLGM